MNIPCVACNSTGVVRYGSEIRLCDQCRRERDVTECLLRHRKAMEDAKFIVEMYAYPDSTGWENMDGDDAGKIWRILEDALEFDDKP